MKRIAATLLHASNLFCLLMTAVLLFTASAWGQDQYGSPVSPVFPTSMAQCDKLQADYNAYRKYLAAEHQTCLDSHRGANSPKASEPAESCAVRACQPLHNRLYSAGSTGSTQVRACRQKVQGILDDQNRRKLEQEAAKRRAMEDKLQADDNRRRKQYGDEQQRTQGTREASARKQADADAAWHQKHDKLIDEQKKKKDDAAATARQEKEARDRRLGVDGFAQKHAAWQARENRRKEQMRKLEEEPASIEDEQQRHAALDRALKQMEQIKAERKRDPEPK